MKLLEWNRLRNETYKNNRAAETPYILKAGSVTAATGGASSSTSQAASAPEEKERPFVYRFFRLADQGTHRVESGQNKVKQRKFETWACYLGDCKD